MTARIHHIVRYRGALLLAATLVAVGLLAVQVSSKQSPHDVYPDSAAEFQLKNPNAFDPARRRSVKALKEPLQSAPSMASGIDTAESEAPELLPDDGTGRVANATFTELNRAAD